MATRNIVPRGNGEGSVGTSAKKWDAVFTNKINGADASLLAGLGNTVMIKRETAYAAGATGTVPGLPIDWILVCTTSGTTADTDITLPGTLIDGATITDGEAGTAVTWTLRKVATEGGLGYRQPSTAYSVGDIAYHLSLPTGNYLECTAAGTTGSGALTIGTTTLGTTVSDGTVVWTISRNLGLIGGGALSGSSLTWNGNDLSGASIVAKSLGSLNGSGYIKYASGLIIQWGTVWSLVANTPKGVTFPIEFPTTGVSIAVSGMDSSAAKPVTGNIKTKSTAEIISASATNAQYIVIGY